MRCDRAKEALSALLDGELTAAEADEVRAHLDGCPACRAELDALRRLVAEVKTLPPVSAPRDLRRKIMARLDEAPARDDTRRVYWRVLWGAAAAVVIGLAFMFVPLFTAPAERARVARTLKPMEDEGAAGATRGALRPFSEEPQDRPRADDEKARQTEFFARAEAPSAGMKPALSARASGDHADGAREEALTRRSVPEKDAGLRAAARESKAPEALFAAPAPAAPPAAGVEGSVAVERSARAKGVRDQSAGSATASPERAPAQEGETALARGGRAPAMSKSLRVDADRVAEVSVPQTNVAAQNAAPVSVTEIVVVAADPVAARRQVEGILARRGVAREIADAAAAADNRARRQEAVESARKSKEIQSASEAGVIALHLTPAQLGRLRADLAAAGLAARTGEVVVLPRGTEANTQSPPPQTRPLPTGRDQRPLLNFSGQAEFLAANAPEGQLAVLILFERPDAGKQGGGDN